MPEKKTVQRAKRKLRQGKSPSTAAGEFVREEIEHVRSGKHGAASTEQAIAIGLAKARRAGIPLPPQPETTAQKRSRRSMASAYEAGQRARAAATRKDLARHAKSVASRRRRQAAAHGR